MTYRYAWVLAALFIGCAISVGPYEARLLQNTHLTLSTNHGDPNGPN